MHLAFVSMHTSPADAPGSGDAGGMNVVERHQAEALGALGHRVELVTRRTSPDAPEQLELSPGVTLRHVAAGPQQPVAKSQQDVLIPQFREGMAALGPFDLVHSHHWMSGVAALPLARGWRVPHVQSFHSVAAAAGSPLSDGEAPESDDRVAGEALVARESDLVLASSNAEARTVIERCGADPVRVSVVPPGVDSALFRPLQPDEPRWVWPGSPETSSHQGYLLFAARLQPLKGADLAISSLAQLPKTLRPHLVVAGEASPDFPSYRRELDQLVHRLGLAGEVTFVGSQQRDELARMLRGARLVLVPSHSETFGLIALEAAASGVPVVAAAAGGLREVVVDGATGRLLPTRDPREWGATVAGLLAEPVLLRRFGQAARTHARSFNWGTVGKRLATIYAELIPTAAGNAVRPAGVQP